MAYWFFRFLTVVSFKLFFRYQIFGRQHIPRKGGFILAGNHTSYIDPPMLGAASPRALFFLAKEELFRNKCFGRFLTAVHAFPLRSQSGDFRALRWAIDQIRTGKAVTIFPEGRRTFGSELDPPLSGIGFLAAKTAAPIVPAYIDGANQALPRGSKMLRCRKIKVYFGTPLFAGDVAAQSGLTDRQLYAKIAEMTMNEIIRMRNNVVNARKKS